MHRLVSALVLLSLSSSSTTTTVNGQSSATAATGGSVPTTEHTPSSCLYCQTKACRCPSTRSILNCSSYLLNLTFASSTCAPTHVWETVDFSLRHLDSFDSYQLLSLRMHRLLLRSNSMATIDDHAFDSIADVLAELDLQTNHLINVSSNWLSSNMSQLRTLNLASNRIESLVLLDAVLLPALQELNLSHNRINVFPDEIRQWTSLTTLDLSFNRLASIPRFALTGLQNLTWLSVASNRNLTCVIQDSFKYLKSLKYLDLSGTSLSDLDACVFIQLTGLRTLRIERVPLNCSSCWLPIAKRNALALVGHCLDATGIQQLDSLTDQQLQHACSKSSIDCSSDYCEAGSVARLNSAEKMFAMVKASDQANNRTIEIVLGVVFGMVALFVVILLIILFIRWRQNKKLFCCHFLQRQTTIAEATRRRRQHHKQIIDRNPAVIESVVTHGANMNVPTYPHQNFGFVHDEISTNKRKLYNPMFAESPTPNSKQQQGAASVLHSSVPSDSHFYSENL